ncbi:MAG TPA: acyl-CoA dehydrogenase C-terminal domain-containing protein, partial [Allosphingosinicella sp.]
ARALAYYAAGQADRGRLGDEQARARADLLTPLVKAWCTDVGCEVASQSVQVHGGMGYIEETGAAQHLRDIRIAPIYEGTNGIQAADLVGRKLGLEGGAVLRSLLGDIRGEAGRGALEDLLTSVERAVAWMDGASAEDRLAGSYPLLTMVSVLVAGWLMGRQQVAAARTLAAGEGDPHFLRMKRAAARYFAAAIVPEAIGLGSAAMIGAETLYRADADAFSA